MKKALVAAALIASVVSSSFAAEPSLTEKEGKALDRLNEKARADNRAYELLED